MTFLKASKPRNLSSLVTLTLSPKCLFLLRRTVAAVQPILVNVGHGDEFDRPLLSRQRVGRRPGSATAATHERDIDGVALTGI